MLIAAIDNSLDLLNIALADNEKILAERNILSSQTPSEIIALALKDTLADANRNIDDIEAVFVTLGPGSFTGIRVSLAFCKGITSAKNIPLVGVPTLDVLAQPLSHMNGYFLCPIIDAKKSEVFLSFYYTSKEGLKRLANYRAIKPNMIHEIIRKPCICFGTGVTACEQFLIGMEGVKIERDMCRTVTAEALIKTGINIMNGSLKHDTKLIYGRKSEAEIKFNVTVD